ncbi:phosphosulfolactate phosphohydrolase-like enzyme [Streptomyces canus]|uniref:Probable 2-phosphosulfolactate phosphatase n=1 Tax=Streptomyces canus TaxID=58343 RepID=A0AAW8F682_9ACTN|nr:2-phosphosulfolactate phosphatase [Streptomyces canus]MDQ0904765.1 phosphosulfolactate phosphohydrolase-like enzyme [Streptomyces canus]
MDPLRLEQYLEAVLRQVEIDEAVVAGALRNATAAAHWLVGQGYGTADRPVAVIASGERWPDGSLRPAMEDLLGAGAIVAALHERLSDTLSPEAAVAAASFQATSDVSAAVAASSSGRELIGGGFAEDVVVAAELDACTAVPVLIEGAFTVTQWASSALPLQGEDGFRD